ncbi:phage portal protein [Cetobacterium sp. ZOR0034]|uniref:phage portal protein n=1 Tax=Cetobacterium sp. ZOR0034 TaxID=1339239 RepID=UPI000648A50F|nr:phage portal protein [Cetobacterium sp. ZOR0034]
MFNFFKNKVATKQRLPPPVKEVKILNYAQGAASPIKNIYKKTRDEINTADEDIGESKDLLMARSSYLYMNNAIGAAAIKKIRTNVIGRGLRVKPSIANEILGLKQEDVDRIHKEISILWEMFTDECDIENFSNFYQIQSLVLINQLVYGETFVLLPLKKREGQLFDLKIKLVDSTRCQNPSGASDRIKNGVEISEDGEIIGYHFTKSNTSSETVRVEPRGKQSGRRNVLCVMEKERIGQRRGVPILAPVIELLYQLSEYTATEITSASVAALFSVFIKNASEDTFTPEGQDPLDNVETDKENDKDYIVKMGYGTINELPPGKDIVLAAPNRNGAGFEEFVKTLLRQLGAALEIPYEILLTHFTASYSASRAALLEVWKMYSMRRSWLVSDFCKPIYEEFLDECVAKGMLKLPGYENILYRKCYQKAEWYGPVQGQLNPVQEVNAAVTKVKVGISTLERETRELNGGDFEANNMQRHIESEKRGELKNESSI